MQYAHVNIDVFITFLVPGVKNTMQYLEYFENKCKNLDQ